MRNKSIDITKGILIFFVVLGHIADGGSYIHKYVYWFHMPAFFIISGLFMRKDCCLKDEIKKRTYRLLVPYLFFSIFFGTIAREGNILKQLVGTIIGANGNITSYTFPYYFLTVLFVASIFLYAINKRTTNATWYLFLGYVVTHVATMFISHDLLSWIPWNVDIAICMAFYMFLGNKHKNLILQNGGVNGAL